MKRFPTLDPESYALAEHFLPKGSSEQLDNLAGCVQEAVEEWLDENVHPEGWDG
jgi:hypothetical protein